MSSSPSRDPLSGVIRQDAKIVGAICLPEADLQDFIEQFNHCYGPLRMKVESPNYLPIPATMLAPVGASHRRPSHAPKSPIITLQADSSE